MNDRNNANINKKNIQKDKFTITYTVTDDLLMQALKLDESVFSKQEVGDFDMCKSWLEKNRDIYTFLLYEGRCIGYINFCRITNDTFNKFYEGKMKDYNLTQQDILPFEVGAHNRCLFMSIAIAKEFRDSYAILKLCDGFYKRLTDFKNKGILIQDVIIDCVSIDGVKFSIEQLCASYIRDSYNGKIYYTQDIFIKRPIPKINLELLNRENLKVASLIQYEIFKNNWCGYCDLLSEIESREKGIDIGLPVTYLIKHFNKPIGIIGLYELKQYPNTIWLNWFGILPKYRNRGFGTHALFMIINLARKFGRKEFRLVTYKIWNHQAQHIYQKTMQRAEPYTNKDDWQYAIKYGKPMIFSSSLVDKTVSKWNNKYVDLLSDETLHNNSLKKLREDGLIK